MCLWTSLATLRAAICNDTPTAWRRRRTPTVRPCWELSLWTNHGSMWRRSRHHSVGERWLEAAKKSAFRIGAASVLFMPYVQFGGRSQSMQRYCLPREARQVLYRDNLPVHG